MNINNFSEVPAVETVLLLLYAMFFMFVVSFKPDCFAVSVTDFVKKSSDT